ncbi:MAG: hypothetical protein JKY70_06765 [Mucilaginibacter sp.]|nr:hypothetical protein [Mucilaginibacter sp.]
MDTNKNEGRVNLPQKNKRLCQLYQQLSQFALGLDKLPDAQEVRRDKPMPVPASELPMVF